MNYIIHKALSQARLRTIFLLHCFLVPMEVGGLEYPSLSGFASSSLSHVSLCLSDCFLKFQLHAVGAPSEKSMVEIEIIAAAKSYTVITI